MTFKVSEPRADRRRAVVWAAGLALSALLASCGGGERVSTFAPTRVLAFGDEASVIDDSGRTGNGRKYTINALAADNATLDCAANPIWVQYLASRFGLVFPQCNPAGVSAPASRIYAVAGATVADVKRQVDLQLAADGFNDRDLVTVLAGANDILAQYAQYPALPEAQLTAAVVQAGSDLAVQVNRVAAAGGKVLVAFVPNLGQTPFGVAEAADPAKGTDRTTLLAKLTESFNGELSFRIRNDGYQIGLIRSEWFDPLISSPSTAGLANVTQAACTTPSAYNCSSATLRPADPVTNTLTATAETWLWADALQLSPVGHLRLGQAADGRARGNPF